MFGFHAMNAARYKATSAWFIAGKLTVVPICAQFSP